MFGLPEGRREMEMHYKSWEKRVWRGEQWPNDSWDNRSTQRGDFFFTSFFLYRVVPLQKMMMIW
jgi:hypothetical protein